MRASDGHAGLFRRIVNDVFLSLALNFLRQTTVSCRWADPATRSAADVVNLYPTEFRNVGQNRTEVDRWPVASITSEKSFMTLTPVVGGFKLF